ncbi:sideroflexin-4 isoform X2 [Protopterus annectens]|uniref:sideroflexin-4 isoform X2 n=1 Tax=Protopterus annectens TaxID=7888 RepID=UPI001CFB6236|nr:sideroflexin-4 isoform X2 [Protopterus annectens]
MQSFHLRFYHWLNILDPLLLLASEGEIRNARDLLSRCDQVSANTDKEKKVKQAWNVSLSSVHPDNGSIIPLLFRPPAFFPAAAPLVLATLLPHTKVFPSFFWQCIFQTYIAGFNLANQNASVEKSQQSFNHIMLCMGAVSYTACLSVMPEYLMKRYNLGSPTMQAFCRKFLPAPLLACMSAFNVMVVRSTESDHGIEVMDKKGNIVGVSKNAGAKAVKETAISRAALIGTSVAIPSIFMSFLQRKNVLRSFRAFTPVSYIVTVVAFGLMVPTSFSLFPQAGKITRDRLEQDIQLATTESELYYYRGV